MPLKNTERQDVEQSFYHVYNRGVNKGVVFSDDRDYVTFFSLLQRYLSKETQTDSKRREYPNYSKQVELLAVCLMPNHFHLLLYQHEAGGVTKLLSSVNTAYTMYSNKQHGRVGHLFQSRYKASRITDDRYLLHISRYIHLNPKDENWQYSSLPYYLGRQQAEWINPLRILDMFESLAEYKEFMNDWKDYKQSLAEIAKGAELL